MNSQPTNQAAYICLWYVCRYITSHCSARMRLLCTAAFRTEWHSVNFINTCIASCLKFLTWYKYVFPLSKYSDMHGSDPSAFCEWWWPMQLRKNSTKITAAHNYKTCVVRTGFEVRSRFCTTPSLAASFCRLCIFLHHWRLLILRLDCFRILFFMEEN